MHASESHELLRAFRAVKRGDFSVRIRGRGAIPEVVVEAFNDVIELNERMTGELVRIANIVGKEGRITQRASLGAAGGSWKSCVQSVNALIGDLVQPTAEIA